MYIIVSPFSNTFDDIGLTYFVPDVLRGEIKPGIIVEIPIKDKSEIAIILDIVSKEDISFSLDKIKSVNSIVSENIFFNNYSREIIKWGAPHYFTAVHNMLNLFFPRNLKEKIKKGTLKFWNTTEYSYTYNNKLHLTSEQKKVYNDIKISDNNKILLYGITGSGKTQIYIELIKDMLKQDKQSLLLIPEIVLTNQISDKIKAIFGDQVIILNSTVSEAKKTQYWLDIKHNKAKIILGTRSALFYPYSNLGIIIIDEEHDNSYISDSSPRYNSREIAEQITVSEKNILLLGSGTPSIKTMFRSLKGEYTLLNLLKKYK